MPEDLHSKTDAELIAMLRTALNKIEASLLLTKSLNKSIQLEPKLQSSLSHLRELMHLVDIYARRKST